MRGVFCVLLILLLTGCAPADDVSLQTEEEVATEEGVMEKISFQTDDGVTIVGNLWKGGGDAILLLHMLPATKESWNDFAEELYNEGYTVLAIDLRGHGESVKQRDTMLNYKTFTDEQHQESIIDVRTAVSYLKEKGASSVAVAGASIGANLALQYQAEDPDIKKTILLSAGLDYRGVETESAAAALRSDQEVYYVAGSFDGDTAETAQILSEKMAGESEVKIYDTTAHGTDLLAGDADLSKELIAWLKS